VQRRAVVGIGAPVAAYLPRACLRLGSRPLIPPDADVANAIGAVTSMVTVTDRATIRPDQYGSYVVYSPDGRQEFGAIEDAEEAAREGVVRRVRAKARTYGTAQQRVRVDVGRRMGRLSDGTLQLVEVEVAGMLTGVPALG
jgi:hypothetical protein